MIRQSGQLLRFVACNQARIQPNKSENLVRTNLRCISNSPIKFKRFGPTQLDEGSAPKRKSFKDSILPDEWHKYIEKYPEFLPHPLHNSPFLVHRCIDDMVARRTVIEIPEFYVGSILAVTVSDQYAETKRSKFVGICIHRTGQLTYANFTLRNIIDGMGCEIRYDLYNPLILSIEVLKLEKRLDDNLLYLRDALPEYSTVSEDMRPISLPEGSEVPLNKTLVKMKPQPWCRRWENWLLQGIEKLENIPQLFAERVKLLEEDPVYSYDLMLEYRRHCTEEMMYTICKRIAEHEEKVVKVRSEARAKRFLRVAKTAPKSAPSKE